MRKLLRSIARANMQKQGVPHINKPKRNPKSGKEPSYFAENWRKYIH